MRIFWHNGGVHVMPENDEESKLLCKLTENLKMEKPPEMQYCIPSGDTPSGDGLFELVVGNEQTSPSGLSGKTNHKKQVICINELP